MLAGVKEVTRLADAGDAHFYRVTLANGNAHKVVISNAERACTGSSDMELLPYAIARAQARPSTQIRPATKL